MKYTIAFDQASQVSGVSVWRGDELINSHNFRTKEEEFFAKVSEVKNHMLSLIDYVKAKEDCTRIVVVLEDIQQQENVQTFKRLAQLQGCLLLALHENASTTVEIVSPSTWRSFNGVKVRGRTQQKQEAQRLVESLFGKKLTQDESESILIGRWSVKSKMEWD